MNAGRRSLRHFRAMVVALVSLIVAMLALVPAAGRLACNGVGGLSILQLYVATSSQTEWGKRTGTRFMVFVLLLGSGRKRVRALVG